jgi:predicted anti-sigma-YlaC factor YlaD
LTLFSKHVLKSLTPYCDGELDAAEKQRVEEHLATCRPCRTALEEIEFSAKLVRHLTSMSTPASIWDGIEAEMSGSSRSLQPATRRGYFRAAHWAFACVLFLAVTGGGYWWTRERTAQPWEVAHTTGGTRRMAAGEWVETGAGSTARIVVGPLGTVDVAPGTRVQLGEVRKSEYRLALAHGTISAEINAPPRLFIVDTPASAVVDLGCAYTVTVGKDGAGELRMTTGWAALEFKGRESLVPAGAMCRTKPGAGPGTPYFEDASATLKRAVDDFDMAAVSLKPDTRSDIVFGVSRTRALDLIIQEARVRDTLTLWHLLSRVAQADRVRVYDRIAAFVPPPAGVSRDRILALDADALRKWREELAWKW